MREVELKGVIPDVEAARLALVTAGATLAEQGALTDLRFDTPDFRLRDRDEVLRIRAFAQHSRTQARLDFKGAATYPDGFKVREETGVEVGDAAPLRHLLEALGYVITREIERQVEVWTLPDALVRFEWYPRMDLLAEIEGEPSAIERAIDIMQLPRSAFTAERLSDFVRRYEARTGERAALCQRELRGEFRYALDDA
jgi:predicted adenylyl cyclase CyaB